MCSGWVQADKFGSKCGGGSIWFWDSDDGASGTSLKSDSCQMEGGGSSGIFARTALWCGSYLRCLWMRCSQLCNIQSDYLALPEILQGTRHSLINPINPFLFKLAGVDSVICKEAEMTGRNDSLLVKARAGQWSPASKSGKDCHFRDT